MMDRSSDGKGTTGGPLDIEEDDVLNHLSDRELKSGAAAELAADELTNADAVAEAVRSKSDAYLVKSDLEDSDERSVSPGMKDQS